MADCRSTSQSIAAYSSFGSTVPRSSICPSVETALSGVRAPAVASFDCASMTRATSSARTRSRRRPGLRASRAGSPSLRTVASTAATWPWGRLRRQVKASSGLTSRSPRRMQRRALMAVAGSLERLARVRFLTRPRSRKDSRRRMAGGEERLGTLSIYMDTIIPLFTDYYKKYATFHPRYYMATFRRTSRQEPRKAFRIYVYGFRTNGR